MLSCILLSAFLANADLAESAHFVTSIINHDIMKALHFGGVCSYTAYEDDQIAIDINIEDLTNLALDILKFVQGCYHYHVLVIENWQGDKWIYGPSCSADNCNLTNTNGVNIITFRQKIYSIELAISAKDWCNKTEATILSVL
uniref:Uncharacterized protein n=1 Tax=Meloidogyne floridensis TaxID=298350 RepID=A0A915PAN8_9BILA